MAGLRLYGVEVSLQKSQPNFAEHYRQASSVPCFTSLGAVRDRVAGAEAGGERAAALQRRRRRRWCCSTDPCSAGPRTGGWRTTCPSVIRSWSARVRKDMAGEDRGPCGGLRGTGGHGTVGGLHPEGIRTRRGGSFSRRPESLRPIGRRRPDRRAEQRNTRDRWRSAMSTAMGETRPRVVTTKTVMTMKRPARRSPCSPPTIIWWRGTWIRSGSTSSSWEIPWGTSCRGMRRRCR